MNSLSSNCVSSFLLYLIDPLPIGANRKMALPIVLFPLPLSPTKPMVVPFRILKETLFTARINSVRLINAPRLAS